jgi:uncharacterized protein (TIGR00730 family)
MTNIIKKGSLKGKSGYTPRVTIFSSRNNTDNPTYIHDAETVAREISEAGYGINNGGSATGLMGVVAKTAQEIGGNIYGIALASHEPDPNPYLDDYEGYLEHSDRQRRLIELGDAFVALPGAIGTFHEILEVHILNILKEIEKPLVLVGEYFARYKELIDSFKAENLMHTDTTPLFYAKDGDEAAKIIIEYFNTLVEKDYYPPTYYPALTSDQIYKHVLKNTENYKILFEKLTVTVFPGVYPSNRFRSSKMFAKLVRSISKGKKVADMACGHGAMGLVALDAGAEEVVMSDINSTAVQNAKYNLEKSQQSDKGVVFESNLFEKIPSIYRNYFDIIFFNPPFHNEKVKKTETSLAHAFKTQNGENSVLVKFLETAKEYLGPHGVIYIGFSNKDKEALELLEHSLITQGYTYEMVELENVETIADNRIYKVSA